MRNMRIGIDARFLGAMKQRGIGRYVQELVHQLLSQKPQDITLVLFLSEEGMQSVPTTEGVEKICAPLPWYSIAEQLYMPGLTKRARVDVMHFPHFNVPWRCPVPYVLTVHDLILLQSHRQRATTLSPIIYRLKYQAWKVLLRHALAHAARIIVPSHAVEHDLVSFMPRVTLKISMIYEGVPTVEAKSIISAKSGSTFGGKNPYILYVGSAYPHKNLERLLQAFALLPTSYHLVLVGKEDYFYQRLKKEQAHLLNNVIFTGEVSDKELAVLYCNATLAVFPSLHEGFGLPPLEAASYGCPVACSNIAVLQEIMGHSAAFFFNPYDVNNMVQVMHEALINEKARQEKIKNARVRAQSFSWSKMATQTLNLYHNTLSQ